MSQRLQLALTVAAVAVTAVGGVVGVTLATRDHPATLHPQPGKPPVSTKLPGKLGAEIRAAIATWPHGSLPKLETLAQSHGRNPMVQLYLGIGLLWAGYTGDAQAALEQVKKKGIGYDTQWEVSADTILHPQYAPNDPIFSPITSNALLERGSRLQSAGHQHSAERVYVRAAQLAPNDPQAQVAAAVGLFDKDNLTAAFSHLGPLVKRFPKSQIVRFYLGFLLAWTDQRDPAIVQFRKAIGLGPKTPLGHEAKAFVDRVTAGGTGTTGK